MTAIVLFVVLAAAVVYIIAGYPLLLRWLARHRAHPVKKAWTPRRVSIVMAVYNGAAYVIDKLDSILALDYPPELREVIVVSDGSTDETEELAGRYAAKGVRLLRLPRGGKPAALNAGAAATSGEIIVFTDVRQQLERSGLKALLAPFADESVGVVSGYLVIRSGGAEEDNVGLYWRYERWIRKQLSAIDSLFGATGSYYAIRRNLFRPMPTDLLLDDMYVPLAAFFEGYRLIIEEAAKAYDYPTGIDAEFRRKVRTLAGVYQIIGMLPVLKRRNRMLFHFVSYKFARLLLPWLMLALLAVSFWLPDPLRIFAVGAAALFLGLAAADRFVPKASPAKRLTSPAGTVAGMLAATASAVCVFFVPAQTLWKQGHAAVAAKSQRI